MTTGLTFPARNTFSLTKADPWPWNPFSMLLCAGGFTKKNFPRFSAQKWNGSQKFITIYVHLGLVAWWLITALDFDVWKRSAAPRRFIFSDDLFPCVRAHFWQRLSFCFVVFYRLVYVIDDEPIWLSEFVLSFWRNICQSLYHFTSVSIWTKTTVRFFDHHFASNTKHQQLNKTPHNSTTTSNIHLKPGLHGTKYQQGDIQCALSKVYSHVMGFLLCSLILCVLRLNRFKHMELQYVLYYPVMLNHFSPAPPRPAPVQTDGAVRIQ